MHHDNKENVLLYVGESICGKTIWNMCHFYVNVFWGFFAIERLTLLTYFSISKRCYHEQVLLYLKVLRNISNNEYRNVFPNFLTILDSFFFIHEYMQNSQVRWDSKVRRTRKRSIVCSIVRWCDA